MSKVAKLLRTPPADLLLIARAWCLFAYVDWVIGRRDYARWPQWMKIKAGDERREGEDHRNAGDRTARIIRLSEIAGRHHLKPMNCLRRCLVQRRLLRKLIGVRAELVLGVKTEGGFGAHSWLTVGDDVINDSLQNLAQYNALAGSGNASPVMNTLLNGD